LDFQFKRKLICFLLVFLSITSTILSQANIGNVIKANKVYCILKYSYPIKNYKKFNWDGLLIDLTDDVLKLKRDEDLIPLLTSYFSPIFKEVHFSTSNTNTFFNSKQSQPVFIYEHKGDGIDAERIKLRVSSYKTTIKKINVSDEGINNNVKISDDLYLSFRFPEKVYNQKYKSKKQIKNIERIGDLSCRVSTLLKLYGIIDNFYPNSTFQKSTLDSVYKETLIKIFNINTYEKYVNIINQFTSITNDGHAQYFLTFTQIKGILAREIPKYYPKFNTIICRNRIYISEVDSSIYNLKSGDRILQINTMSDSLFITQKFQLVSANTINHKIYKGNAILFTSFKRDSTINLVIQRKDSVFLCQILTSSSNYFEKNKIKLSPLIMSPDSIVIIDLTSEDLSEKLIKKNIELLNNSKGIVFKLTGYPNYNAGNVLAYFTDTLLTSLDFLVPIKRGLISNPANFAIENWTIKPKNKIKNKYVFVSEFTVSWGETLLEMVKNSNMGTIIGNPSADSNGDIVSISLPIGSYFMTGLKVERNNKHVGAIVPDIDLQIPFGCPDNLPVYLQKAKEIISEDEK